MAAESRLPHRARTIHYLLEGAAVLLLVILVLSVAALHITRPPIPYQAQVASLERTVAAQVLAVGRTQNTVDENGLVQVQQTLTLRLLAPGADQGREVTVAYAGLGPSLEVAGFRSGQLALVMIGQGPDGQPRYQVADHVRWGPLGALALTFIVVTVWIGRQQGLRALLGLLLSGLLIGGFILPQILAHRDAVLIALVGVALLMGLSLYLIQGWNTIAHTAFLGLLGSLLFTGMLAIGWSALAHLTGFGSEETMFLQAVGVGVQMRGLLLAGMIIGAAGVLDDVVLAQAVAVFEIAAAAPNLPRRSLYQRGMKVGVAHLASMVNTLVLAYASTALPLLLLFYLYPEPWYLTLNRELIAEEIVRTLVGSLGLMLAVPLTTAIAAWLAGGFTPTPSAADSPTPSPSA